MKVENYLGAVEIAEHLESNIDKWVKEDAQSSLPCYTASR